MPEAKDAPMAARVVAGVPLLQAGLEQAALAVGLRVADGEEAAAIGLRSPNAGPTLAAIDVCADADHVVITLTAVPDSKTWFRLHALLRELLDTSS
jgi:alkylation response protein AidB-like acyl-CoA dehydrogenase